MKKQKVTILGADWEVVEGTAEEFPTLGVCDGYTDVSIHRIVVSDMSGASDDPESKVDLKAYQRQVVRHELIHAFLEESGLSSNTAPVASWATSEEIVDWIAIQIPKIVKACSDLRAL